jgi:curli production assembly/transport component CsgF
MKYIITIILLGIVSSVNAQDLVYKPRNPAFGGDTFNYQWMMSSAEAQNTLKDKSIEKEEKSDLENFLDNLNSQLLNQITRSLFIEQFGTEGISEGTYTFGSLSVEVYPSTGGLTISILDITTGEQTQVLIPKP